MRGAADTHSTAAHPSGATAEMRATADMRGTTAEVGAAAAHGMRRSAATTSTSTSAAPSRGRNGRTRESSGENNHGIEFDF
jgi:hypothetical protein